MRVARPIGSANSKKQNIVRAHVITLVIFSIYNTQHIKAHNGEPCRHWLKTALDDDIWTAMEDNYVDFTLTSSQLQLQSGRRVLETM
jgi:hypothetical protein